MHFHFINTRILLRGLLVIGILVLLGYLIKLSGIDTLLSKSWIDTEIRGRGLYGELLFVVIGMLFTAFGFPRQIISFLGGYGFGFVYGSLLALVASAGGCILAYYYARILGRRLFSGTVPKRIQKLDEFIHENPFNMTLLIRLLPAGSNLLTNLAAGMSSVRPFYFFAGSALGYIPQTLIFALIGSGIHLDPVLRISIGAALFFISGMLGIYLYRKHRHGKTLDEELERELADEEDSPLDSEHTP